MYKTSIEQFLRRFKSQSTHACYKVIFRQFFDQYLRMTPEQYFNQDRNFEQDLHDYKNHMDDAMGLAPKSVESKMGGLFSYFLANRAVTRELWKELNLSCERVVKHKTPTKDEVRTLLSYMDVRSRAFFITLATSGMRKEDLLAIKITPEFHKNLKKNPPRIYTYCHKMRKNYWAFITPEARDHLYQWLEARETYIAEKRRYNIGETKDNTERLFPFDDTSIYRMWRQALQKAGFAEIDEGTQQKRFILHPHCLRKFFRTYGVVQINSVELKEALLCHITGTNQFYFDQEADRLLAPEYLKAIPDLTFYSVATVISANEELEVLKRKLEAQQSLIDSLNTGMRNIAMTHPNPEIRDLWSGQ